MIKGSIIHKVPNYLFEFLYASYYLCFYTLLRRYIIVPSNDCIKNKNIDICWNSLEFSFVDGGGILMFVICNFMYQNIGGT